MSQEERVMSCMRFAILVVIGVLLTGSVVADEMDKNEKHWRYRIFTAEHQSVERGGGSKVVKSIFKIDLDTGKVWRYRQGIDQDGKKYEEFFEIPEQ